MFSDIQFANPEYLWGFLLLLPLGVWYGFKRKQQQARLTLSSLEGFKGTPSLLVKLFPLLFVFRILAMSFILLAIARPQTVDVSTRTKTN
ncbi:BatA domain-containing protein, partial [Flavobacteriaceae bacterium]|nr:BatA domain-containing protein [Flavobacteriaceae bacterium]